MDEWPAETGISARSVILDLLATGAGAAFSAADLLRAGAAFGLASVAMRTAMTRLKSEGRLVQKARGLYAVGPAAAALQRRVLGWRSVQARRRGWGGQWLLALAGPDERADRTAWRRTLRALALEGFVEAETNVWVRPANLAGGAGAMRARLGELGYAPSLLIVTADEVDMVRADRFAGLWDGAAIAARHVAVAAALESSEARLADAGLATAAAETLALGSLAVRRIVRDPLLPESFGTADALAGLVAAMDRYDRFGKAIWKRYLAG